MNTITPGYTKNLTDPRWIVAGFVVNDLVEAYTQGHFVFCRAKAACGTSLDLQYPNLLPHELVHVRQWEQEGDMFGIRYLQFEAAGLSGQCGNPYEVIAYSHAPIFSSGPLECP